MKIVVTSKKTANKKFTKVLFFEKIPANRLKIENGEKFLEIKTPKKKELNRRKWIILVRGIIQEVKRNKIENILIDWNELVGLGDFGNELGQLFAENAIMAEYKFLKYKKKPKKDWDNIKEIVLVANNKENFKLKKEIKKGLLIAREVNHCRDLANIPGRDMTPEILVKEIKKTVKETKIKMTVFNEKQLKQKKMNGILAVGSGSQYAPKFIILEYL